MRTPFGTSSCTLSFIKCLVKKCLTCETSAKNKCFSNGYHISYDIHLHFQFHEVLFIPTSFNCFLWWVVHMVGDEKLICHNSVCYDRCFKQISHNIIIFTFIKIEFQFALVYVYLWVSEANIYTIKQSCKKNHKAKLKVT